MMTSLRYGTICSVLVLFPILIHVKTEPQDISNVQHLPDIKFNSNEYSEYPDNEDRVSMMQQDEQQHIKDNLYLRGNSHLDKEDSVITDALDKNIAWDVHWAAQLKLTQMSAVSMDPYGNIAIFHRGNRIWGPDTFDNRNRFDPNNGPITQNTIVLLNKSGKVILEFGKNMFYLPHGLTIDKSGNYWITDVAMHQVFKFNAQDIEKHMEELKRTQFTSMTGVSSDHTNINSILKPSIILGEAFVPGNDETRFCKPTAVAVHTNGDFFVSDGYCNSRIIKFNKNGERILHWGRHWGAGEPVYSQLPPPNAFLVPHALALASELNYIYVADRENGRILCFFASNGTFHKEYRDPAIGAQIYSVSYAREKLYLVNGQDLYNPINPIPVRGFVLDIYSGNILSVFAPKGNMDKPHDLYVTEDGSEIYVVELNNHQIYRFLQGVNDSVHLEDSQSIKRHRPKILVHPDTKDADIEKTNMTKLILGLGSAAISFITICVAIAAIVARCQKRGCLLTMRKRMRWEAERRENFKLSSLLENRRGRSFKFLEKRPNTRDFSKLNTEPETSEDEHPENSLAKVI
ncbi:peptidyl-alpha-hydroxyglycine alpha-amidating lyase 1-like isoform X2 [Nylanderia fulva]|uniref:peptidyl-alpha-hydroxyglycine alpha-amidating lyase 1-like isoform X2 n=1 Tax=Nylanderia fulva TaxID=613905 RepID=UPI0010FBB4BF|nr:peptidyl-alpha-hydroxyglycine alpha-amidating lyase 1-like isoform X2 [Nylanderia fulva]